MTVLNRVPDSVRLAAWILVLSIGLLGLQVQTARYAYGSFSIPYPIVLAPILGIVVYHWASSTTETVTALVGITLLTGVGTTAVLATPIFIQDLPVPQENVILMGAIQESIGYAALGGILLAAGAVVGAVTRHSIDLELGPSRSVVVGVVCLLVGALLAGSIIINLSSATEQSGVEAEIESIDAAEDALNVRLTVENRLTEEMRIDSGNLQLSSDGGSVSVSGFPEESIPSGEVGTVTLETSCENLADGGVGQSGQLQVTGQLSAGSFNAYEFRISVRQVTVTVPC